MKFDILIDNTSEVNTNLLAIHDQRSSGSYHFKFHSAAMTATFEFHVNFHFFVKSFHTTKQKKGNSSQNFTISKISAVAA